MLSEKVSVLMGVYNCAETLGDAIASIQAQTYTNWELIICDDGSTDNTSMVAQSYAYADNRIIFLQNQKNEGLNRTLNNCLRSASGEFIARMDGDDICNPKRFETQVNYLKENPAISIVSSEMFFFDESGIWGGTKNKKDFPQCRDVVEGSPICHAPVMMRKECMDAVGGYTEAKWCMRVEDVDLWIKLYAAGYRCHNLSQQLYGMRNDQNAFNRRKYKYRVNSTIVRLRGCRTLHLGCKSYMLSFLPMVIGLVPARIRRMIRKIKK